MAEIAGKAAPEAVAAAAEDDSGKEGEEASIGYSGHKLDERCLEPWRYILEVPGKNIRGKLIDAFNVWLKVPEEKVDTIKQIVRYLHTASLLIDDIEDNSKLRRGVPVAHSIFGVPSTINCSNYVYFLALELCQSLDNADAMQVFVFELLNLHRGQGQDILWRDTGSCPTEEEYKRMVLDKTGGLFRLAVGLMAALSEEADKDAYTPLVNALALYFQIRDDYVNLASPKYQRNKSFCEDLTEGKFSFPIIHAILSNPSDHRILSILKQRTDDESIKRFAVDYLIKQGSIAYTREVLATLRDDCLSAIDELGGHRKLSALLLDLDRQLDDEDVRILPAGLEPPPLPRVESL